MLSRGLVVWSKRCLLDDRLPELHAVPTEEGNPLDEHEGNVMQYVQRFGNCTFPAR